MAQQQQQQQQQPEEPPPLPRITDLASYDDAVGQLDLLLAYLWRVHGVDYYSGYELAHDEFPQRLTACRLLRGPRPPHAESMPDPPAAAAAGGEQEAAAGENGGGGGGAGGMEVEAAAADGAAKVQEEEGGEGGKEGEKAKEEEGAGKEVVAAAAGGKEGGGKAVAAAGRSAEEEAEAAARSIEAFWDRRISAGDPLEAKCQRRRVEEALDKWVESQVIFYDENKCVTTLFGGRIPRCCPPDAPQISGPLKAGRRIGTSARVQAWLSSARRARGERAVLLLSVFTSSVRVLCVPCCACSGGAPT